jgi:hypothetical protein
MILLNFLWHLSAFFCTMATAGFVRVLTNRSPELVLDPFPDQDLVDLDLTRPHPQVILPY